MTADAFRPCAVVPSCNHWRAVGDVVAHLRSEGLDVFIIDDGSDEPARSTLAALHDPAAGVTVHRFATNQGKGAAVLHGFRAAFKAGFSHAIQVDADGQHDPAAIPQLIERARRHPEALVTGVPVYDSTIPLGRAIGRWITHFWVWVETLSFRIRDSMCGFRVYPLAAVRALEATGVRLGRRMDFDTEIMVRLFWLGTPVAELPVRVSYPPDNISNFRMLRDNVRISTLHTRLVVRMLLTFPAILGKRPPRLSGYENARHWSAMGERGLYWGLAFCVAAYRLLGRKGCMAVMAPIVLYFYLTGTEQRRFSRQFLTRAFKARGSTRQPAPADGYRHFMSFAGRTLDTFIGWTGGIARDRLQPGDITALHEIQSRSRGVLFIISHLGNVDLLRAVLDDGQRRRLTILVHTRHAENYNRILRKFNPEAGINLLQVTEMGPETAIALQERIDAGHWVMIAGDRTPVTGQSRVSTVPFLGEPAAFSQGPYILAALLECPVYLLFCLRDGDHHRYHVEKLAEAVELPRGRRDEAIRAYAAAFAARLEHHALTDPFQWYNFFDFWKPQGGGRQGMISAEISVQAQFYDLDPMQIVWHGNYARFLEQARCALLDRIGYNYPDMAESGTGWPIVDMRIKYVRSIRFAQTVRVQATLVEYENRIRIDYRILDDATGALLTKARTDQVAVCAATGELRFESPASFIDKVRKLL